MALAIFEDKASRSMKKYEDYLLSNEGSGNKKMGQPSTGGTRSALGVLNSYLVVDLFVQSK
jgi:hypothetical protein